MRPVLSLLLVAGVTTLIGLMGCGGGDSSSQNPQAVADSGGSPLNTGPKAIETVRLNPGLADYGAKVFKQRACITCHAIGERKQGPDLAGVANRRTEEWIRKQITDPEWMLKNDPIARELMAEYALQMANQHVPEQEVKALIHYFVKDAQTKAGQ